MPVSLYPARPDPEPLRALQPSTGVAQPEDGRTGSDRWIVLAVDTFSPLWELPDTLIAAAAAYPAYPVSSHRPGVLELWREGGSTFSDGVVLLCLPRSEVMPVIEALGRVGLRYETAGPGPQLPDGVEQPVMMLCLAQLYDSTTRADPVRDLPLGGEIAAATGRLHTVIDAAATVGADRDAVLEVVTTLWQTGLSRAEEVRLLTAVTALCT